jgi:tetratricopeptide (TPR) repeat protein
MAKTKKKQEGEGTELIENPDALASKAEEFFNNKKNQNLVFGIGGFIALVVAGFLFYTYYINNQNEEAQREMFQAIYYYEADSLSQALNGDGNAYGFLDIIDLYGGTEAENLANFYVGSIYMKLNNFDNAVRYFDAFSSSDVLLQSRAYALQGDAYMELDDFASAVDAYKSAVNYMPNDVYTPIYLKKLAIAYEENGEFEAASAAYQQIIDDFPTSDLVQEANKHAARLNSLAASE